MFSGSEVSTLNTKVTEEYNKEAPPAIAEITGLKKDYGGATSANLEPLDNLAHAVAIAETSNCTKGYAITHNNCHGIKKGNTYPCKLKPGSKSRMCNFATKEESFKAFKIIWGKWYHNPPTLRDAGVWTGHDDAYTWLKNVKSNL